MEGQNIYIYDVYNTHEPLAIVTGFIAPRPGEDLVIFKEDDEIYHRCKVVNVAHAANTQSGKLNTIVNVECYAKTK